MGFLEIVGVVLVFAFWMVAFLLAVAVPCLTVLGLICYGVDDQGHPAGCLLAVVVAFLVICVAGYCNVNCKFEAADRANERMHQLLD
jgi:hypothetical protein